jgi:FMN phosphatase YigB (HAD superfamily)
MRPGSSHTAADIVVFDLGGVLVQIVRSWDEAHERAGYRAGGVPSTEAWTRERAALARAHQLGAITPEQWAEAAAKASGGVYTPDDVVRILEAWQWEEYPHVDRLVEVIEATGVATGALSNTNALHWSALRPEAGEPRFPTVARLQHAHASHLLRLMKPEPDVYAAFEAETGFAGERIVFFDDLEENVLAARAAGWRAERIDYLGDTAEQMHGHLRRFGVLE